MVFPIIAIIILASTLGLGTFLAADKIKTEQKHGVPSRSLKWWRDRSTEGAALGETTLDFVTGKKTGNYIDDFVAALRKEIGSKATSNYGSIARPYKRKNLYG